MITAYRRDILRECTQFVQSIAGLLPILNPLQGYFRESLGSPYQKTIPHDIMESQVSQVVAPPPGGEESPHSIGHGAG